VRRTAAHRAVSRVCVVTGAHRRRCFPRAMPCRTLVCPVPCRAVPCRAVPCRAVPCRAVPCRVIPSCHAVSWRQVEEDPEYEFSDNFRRSRKSNRHRHLLLHRLSNKLSASLSRKVRALGGNAILGYQQHFDIEGDSGIVGRAYGTAFWCVLLCLRAACRLSRTLCVSLRCHCAGPPCRRRLRSVVPRSEREKVDNALYGRVANRALPHSAYSLGAWPAFVDSSSPVPRPRSPTAKVLSGSGGGGSGSMSRLPLPGRADVLDAPVLTLEPPHPAALVSLAATAASSPVTVPPPPLPAPAAAGVAALVSAAISRGSSATGRAVSASPEALLDEHEREARARRERKASLLGMGEREETQSVSSHGLSDKRERHSSQMYGEEEGLGSIRSGSDARGMLNTATGEAYIAMHDLKGKAIDSRHTLGCHQLLSVTILPPDMKVNLGGMVAARSVKYLGKLNTNVRVRARCGALCRGSRRVTASLCVVLWARTSATFGGPSCARSC
jgi:hypothetical protein